MPVAKGKCKHCGKAIYTVGGTLQPWKHVTTRSWFCLDLFERLTLIAAGTQHNGWDSAEPEQEGGVVAEDSRS